MDNQTNDVQVSLEFTPNPNTLKFVVNQRLLDKGAVNFSSAEQANQKSPLAVALFDIPGISAIMLGSHFVTITKASQGDWDIIAEKVPETIQSHLKAGLLVLEPGFVVDSHQSSSSSNPEDQEIERKIKELLDNEIRPAVAMDGGDITFGKYEDGVVYLSLQGSCSSCPSSTATLKMGVETRLKEVIPQIKEVVPY